MTRSAALAGEIAETRARITRTLGLLDRGHALRFLVTRAAALLQEPRVPPGGAAQALRRNAVPIGLMLAGAGWLALANRRSLAAASALLHAALERATRFLGRIGAAAGAPTPGAAELPCALRAAPALDAAPDAPPPQAGA